MAKVKTIKPSPRVSLTARMPARASAPVAVLNLGALSDTGPVSRLPRGVKARPKGLA
jgi:hypothetical protein